MVGSRQKFCRGNNIFFVFQYRQTCHCSVLQGLQRPKKKHFSANFYDSEEVNTLFGMRRSEALGVKWDAIDFEKNTITAKHTVLALTLTEKSVSSPQIGQKENAVCAVARTSKTTPDMSAQTKSVILSNQIMVPSNFLSCLKNTGRASRQKEQK